MSPIALLLLVVVLLLLVGALPAWPHSRSWGYAPVSVGGIVLVLFVVWLLFFGGLRHF